MEFLEHLFNVLVIFVVLAAAVLPDFFTSPNKPAKDSHRLSHIKFMLGTLR